MSLMEPTVPFLLTLSVSRSRLGIVVVMCLKSS